MASISCPIGQSRLTDCCSVRQKNPQLEPWLQFLWCKFYEWLVLTPRCDTEILAVAASIVLRALCCEGVTFPVWCRFLGRHARTFE